MSAEIIKFSDSVSRRAATDKIASAFNGFRQPRPELSVTAKNSRLRIERRDVWWMAEAAVRYWSARREFNSAVERAQKCGIPEGRSHASFNPDDDSDLVARWREAIVRQLLAPAPDAMAVKWKQAQDDRYLPVEPKRIERAIADDLAFLAAHPTKRSNSEAMARSREFKEAMRQRIREVAAARGLSDEEIKPILRLKHQDIGEFCMKHSVSLEWLLEGAGPIFKKYD
jgi:hypothetical protein